MLVLALDTTTPSGSVALLQEGKLIGEVCGESPQSHSGKLLGMVELLLRQHGLEVGRIDGFAVAAGPGSFTGIRIGLSTVKSLAFASGKPVAPVSTLTALAWKLKEPDGRLIIPMLDAKKGEVYAALMESKGKGLEEVIPQGAYGPERFLSLLPSRRVMHFIGTGVQVYKEKILAYIKDKARFSPRSLFIAAEVGFIGCELLRRNQGVAYNALEPLYFRKSQAEEKK